MLVLSRQINESILVGDIEVMVVGILGDKVRLGITAPKDVPVDRKEVRDAIDKTARRRVEKETGLGSPLHPRG